MTVPRSRPAAQPRRVVRRVARPSRRASSMSAGAGSPATARAVSGASPTTPTDGAGRTRPSVSGCASSTALASVPSGHAWPRLTRTASAAPAKPAPRPSDASSRPMSLSTAPSWPLSEHAEMRPTSRRSPMVPDEGFYRAGRTRPGPRVHGAHYGPPWGGRSEDGSSRRPRWDIDAGITERDVAALCWLGQQYAARSDVLRVLLGRLSPGSPKVTGQLSEQTLRQILGRWEDRGLIARDRLLGYQWVAPTAKAVRLVGLDVRAWSFVIPQLAHVHAVGVVRLALEPSIPTGGRWLSERELRREAGKSHVTDAAIELPEDPVTTASLGLYGEDVDPLPKRVAVEVELTRKGAARLREAWTRPRHGRWTRTVYYAPPEVAGYLTGQLQRIRPRHPIQVHPLPDVPGTTYLRPGGAT